MNRLLLISILIFCFSFVKGQRYQEDVDIQQLIEQIFSVQDDDIDYEELYESLLLYYTNPLDLNSATGEEIRSLFILSEYQITKFLEHREKFGKLLSIYELQSVPGLDLATINNLLPFVMVKETGLSADNRPLLKRIFQEENNYLLLRYERTLETKKGYKTPVIEPDDPVPTRYVGASGKHYARFRVSHPRDFSLGFTAEKDAGEEYIWDPETKRYGADFYSFHIHLENKGNFKDIIVGDYQIQFGQSLLLGAGFNVGKGAETITTVRRSNLGIRPYTSVIETNYFKGAAATYSLTNKIDITGFYSRLGQDAILRVDTVSEIDEFISSIQSSGFHRTPNEIEAKNDIIEQTFGGNILFQDKKSSLQTGFTFIANDFEIPLLRSDALYNKFEFGGTFNYNIGFLLNYTWQNFNFFSEAARSKSGGIGAVGGFIASLTPKLETSVVLRNYDKDFHSFYGNAFAESSVRNINERGWYWGLKYTPSRRYEFMAYFDQFTFPWIKFSINAPSTGYEYLFRANYKPRRGTLIYAQFRRELKADNPSSDEQEAVIKFPLDGIKTNYIASLDHKINDNLGIKSRVQWSTYDFNGQKSNGYAIIQDVYISYWKLRLSGRMAIFDTEDFENRQYAYERDVLYGFSIPAYNGRGTRQFLLLQYKATRKLDFWIRYARTHYRDRDTISSGLEEIDGNIKTDIKLQVRIKF